MPDLSAAHPPQTVLLRHVLPDGAQHVDWLIDVDPDRELTTFRLDRRVDELAPGQRVQVERLPDHRRAYLSYEGPISGDRGHVTRVAAGRLEALQTLGDDWALLIRWSDRDGMPLPRPCQPVRVHRDAQGRWKVEVRRPVSDRVGGSRQAGPTREQP